MSCHPPNPKHSPLSFPPLRGAPSPNARADGAASYQSSHVVSGHRLTYANCNLQLTQTLPLPPSTGPMPLSADRTIQDRARSLDPSGAYLLTAALRVADGANVDLMGRGFGELAALKERLKGAVELEMGDRVAMNTRVREVV